MRKIKNWLNTFSTKKLRRIKKLSNVLYFVLLALDISYVIVVLLLNYKMNDTTLMTNKMLVILIGYIGILNAFIAIMFAKLEEVCKDYLQYREKEKKRNAIINCIAKQQLGRLKIVDEELNKRIFLSSLAGKRVYVKILITKCYVMICINNKSIKRYIWDDDLLEFFDITI